MEEDNKENKTKIFRPDNKDNLGTGKIQINDSGEYYVPDRRRMYKEAFEKAKNSAAEAGLVSASLISVDDIKVLSGRKQKQTKKAKSTKSSKKRRK